MGRNTTGPPRDAPPHVSYVEYAPGYRRRWQTPEVITSLALLHYVQAGQ